MKQTFQRNHSVVAVKQPYSHGMHMNITTLLLCKHGEFWNNSSVSLFSIKNVLRRAGQGQNFILQQTAAQSMRHVRENGYGSQACHRVQLPGKLARIQKPYTDGLLFSDECPDQTWSIRGAGSWWGWSDSGSGLLIDSDSCSDSDSDYGSDTKYKMSSTVIVERVSAVQATKRNVTFPIHFGFHSFGRKIFNPSYLTPISVFVIELGVEAKF